MALTLNVFIHDFHSRSRKKTSAINGVKEQMLGIALSKRKTSSIDLFARISIAFLPCYFDVLSLAKVLLFQLFCCHSVLTLIAPPVALVHAHRFHEVVAHIWVHEGVLRGTV